ARNGARRQCDHIQGMCIEHYIFAGILRHASRISQNEFEEPTVMHDRREENEEQEQGVSRLAWFLTGALIGAAVAVLYAPKAGKDTRNYIAEKTQQGKEAVETASDSIVEASREMFDRGRELVDDAADLLERGKRLL